MAKQPDSTANGDRVDLQFGHFAFEKQDGRLIISYIVVSLVALLIGTFAGVLQVLVRGGLIELPAQLYYLLLTLHGVSLALIYTTLFIFGFLYSGVIKTTGGRMSDNNRTIAWVGFFMMIIGTVMAVSMIASYKASVLYTFYAPLHAAPWFYVGMALVVVGSWVSTIPIFSSYITWRKRNPNQPSPLFAYMSVAVCILWIIATLGVVAEVLFQLIPWSFGWVDTINVELSRTLFWYFGHPLVYFWLLPAYIYWYVNVPYLIKGKLFSNTLPRLTFILFLFYSIPVGLHHQLMEPGVSSLWKFIQVVLTMLVVIPSLMTVFAVFATFEIAGREKGATGRFGWFKKLPWGDARFLTPFLAMAMFVPAGAGGIINASYQLNQTVHNTIWIVGHFHMALTTIIMTFFGISYWLVPLIMRREYTPLANRIGILQCVLFFGGMLIMSVAQHIVGLMGVPRRSYYSTYNDHPVVNDWTPYLKIAAIGGVVLYIGLLVYLVNVVYLMFFAPKVKSLTVYPIGVVNEKSQKPPMIFEKWSLWIAITFVLILLAYTVPIVQMIQHAPPGSPPIRSW